VKELALPATMDQQQQQQQVSRDPRHLSQRNTVHRRRRGEQSIFADQVVDVESSFFQARVQAAALQEVKERGHRETSMLLLQRSSLIDKLVLVTKTFLLLPIT
jgi:hypothetical protein